MTRKPTASKGPSRVDAAPINPTDTLSRERKGLMVLLLIVAAFILCLPLSLHVVSVFFFPMGLAFLADSATNGKLDLSGVFLWAGWILYGCLLVAFLRISRRKYCYCLFAAMVFLVTLNCIGCRLVEYKTN